MGVKKSNVTVSKGGKQRDEALICAHPRMMLGCVLNNLCALATGLLSVEVGGCGFSIFCKGFFFFYFHFKVCLKAFRDSGERRSSVGFPRCEAPD